MIDERAARHAGRHGVLVEGVAADHPNSAGRQGALAGVRARQRDQLVAPLHQSGGERAADQASATGEEDAHHALRSSRAIPGRTRMR